MVDKTITISRCTIFRWFGVQGWFDARFKDLCDAHDEAYALRIWREKVTSDFILSAGFASRGYTTIAFLAIIYTTTLGTLFWTYKKLRKR